MRDFTIVMGRDIIIMALVMLWTGIYEEGGYGWMSLGYSDVISVDMNIQINIASISLK